MRALIALTFCLVFVAGCSSSPEDNPSGDQNATVTIKDNNFNPTTVNILEDSTVEWTNTGAATHTVTADDGSFDSGDIAAGGKYPREFDTKGTFPYHCKIHPSMKGTITVG